jgi:hypothetical protein
MNKFLNALNNYIQCGRAQIIQHRSRQALFFFNQVTEVMIVDEVGYYDAYQVTKISWPVCAEWQPE